MTGVTSHPSAPMPSTSCSIGRPRRDAVSSSSSTRRMRFWRGRGGAAAEKEGAPGVRAAPNALLPHGRTSRDVVLVIATNRPEDLDTAVPIAWTRRWNSRCPTRTRAQDGAPCISTNSSFAARTRETTHPRRVSSGRSDRKGGRVRVGRFGCSSSSIPRSTTRGGARWRSAGGLQRREIAKMMASAGGGTGPSPTFARDALRGGGAVAEHASRKTGFADSKSAEGGRRRREHPSRAAPEKVVVRIVTINTLTRIAKGHGETVAESVGPARRITCPLVAALCTRPTTRRPLAVFPRFSSVASTAIFPPLYSASAHAPARTAITDPTW